MDSRLVLRSLFAFPKSAFLPDTATMSRAPRRATAALARARRTWPATCLLSVLVFAGAAVSPLHAQTAYFAGAVTTLGGGFYIPGGVAVDSSGNVYVADSSAVKGAVYEMPAGCSSSSCVMTLGGGFFEPLHVAVDGSGNVYVVDLNGLVTEMPPGCSSSNCVTALGGGFVYPFGVAVDASGNVYVSDQQNGGAVKVMPPGCTSTNFTNNACAIGTLGGGFQSPQGLAVDASGNVYVSDQQNGGAVKEMPSGCASLSCVTNLGGGFDNPWGVAVDTSGNVYVADTYSGLVKEMPPGCTSSNFTSSACAITTLGGAFIYPYDVAVDGSGNVYVAGATTARWRRSQPHGVNLGTVAVGTTAPPVTLYFTFTAGGSGITASVLTQGATGLDFTDAGTGSCDTNGSSHVYNPGDTCTVNVTFAPKYAGARYGAVNLPDAGGVIATAYIYGIGTGPQVAFGPGIISTVAGNESGGYSGDGGAATSAELAFPAGVAVDGAGNLYIADYGNQRIRKVTPGGTITTVAGNGNGGYSGDGGPATSAELAHPYGVAVDGAGNLYIADAATTASAR